MATDAEDGCHSSMMTHNCQYLIATCMKLCLEIWSFREEILGFLSCIIKAKNQGCRFWFEVSIIAYNFDFWMKSVYAVIFMSKTLMIRRMASVSL